MNGSGPAREIPCLACAKAAANRGDGVCHDYLAKPNSARCEHCWASCRPCIPAVAALLPLIRDVTEAIAAGDEQEIKQARCKLGVETRKYPNRVGEKNGQRRRRERRSGASRASAPRKAKQKQVRSSEQPPPESTSGSEPEPLNSISVALTSELIGELTASVSGSIAPDIKQELLEIGNEIYQTGAENLGIEDQDGPIKTDDRLKDIGERLVYIASKLKTE